jgi:hypothetical protein
MKVMIRENGEEKGYFVNIDGAVMPTIGDRILVKDASPPKEDPIRNYGVNVVNRFLRIYKDDRGVPEAYVVLDVHGEE